MSGQATDAFVVELHALWKRLLDNYDIDVPQLLILAGQLRDSLPPCPTCGGSAWFIEAGGQEMTPCPDCVDGKVSVEQLAATWWAVWEDNNTRRDCSCIDRLRAVRP